MKIDIYYVIEKTIVVLWHLFEIVLISAIVSAVIIPIMAWWFGVL